MQHLHQLCHNNIILNNNFNYQNVKLMCFSKYICLCTNRFGSKHEKHKNVVVVHVLQHFSIEYVLTKLILQYEIQILMITNNITGYLPQCYIYVFFNNPYKRLGHMSVKREYLSSPVKS